MKGKLEMHVSPLTNLIFCGKVLKRGTWANGKQEMTIEALVAVSEHVVKFGKPVEIRTESGDLEYTITVKKSKISVDGMRQHDKP